jgi:hypothetical protein
MKLMRLKKEQEICKFRANKTFQPRFARGL